jgi:signal transduction histidine kinase
MLTGYASLESAIEALREGAYDYLVKPCHVDELKATVARGVERGQLARALRARIAELDEANSQLRTLSDELQARVDAATADLRGKVEELASANLQLEAAAREREEFVSMAAHELKTPVTGLRVAAQLLLRRLAQGQELTREDLERRLTLLDQQSDKLARLVSQMLDLSRVEAGRLNLEIEPVDLSALAAGVVENERLKTNRHAITLVAPKNLMARVDPLRIDQSITNLIDNAIKYSPEGGDILVELSQPTRDRIKISVTDHGMGIAPEHRPHIFERFYRGDDSQHQAGVGIGLYITRQIVELHGGEIFAEHPAEGGTRFIIRLPVTRSRRTRATEPAKKERAKSPAS